MKSVFTIPAGVSFLDVLAGGLWKKAGGDAAQLAAMQVFLPTRRACRSLREAFLRQSGGRPLLLPRLCPLGEIDEEELLFADTGIADAIPPAISPLRRRLLLAQLIRRKDAAMPADQAVHVAEALAKFLDEAQIHRCDLGRLPHLVEQRELAQHWQETVRFLDILATAWPSILAAEGCLDPVERRNRVVAAQIAAWRAIPPADPIIAAGSTGSMPTTADVLGAIAALPAGCVVLPGLDTAMDEEAWQAVDELHPQHSMKSLLALMDVARKNVKLWSAAAADAPRAHLLREAMRPASVSEGWRDLRPDTIPAEALRGLHRATFAHPQEEAQGIGLMLRHALETPGHMAALVTPDRGLAERVVALLARWGIEANDSAGSSLAQQPVGGFLSSVLGAAVPDAGAVAWLSLLKHPYTACGLATAECRVRARHVEMSFWRTERPETSPWLDGLKQILRPLTDAWGQLRPLTDWLADHLRLAEILAASDDTSGADRLWRGEAGHAAAEWLDELRAASDTFEPIDGATYRNLFGELLRQARFRPNHGLHPRLSILGPLEARLLRFDFVILGGMNEGVWPQEIEADPWMSRPMKRDFGLMPPEQRIGLSAHDFVQLASSPRTVMTRSLRSGGAPTVSSRFLLQLETVLRALGWSDGERDALQPAEPWQVFARMLDEPALDASKPCAAPEPKPPAALRPTQLSVTEISTWLRNPYAIYARHVLGLRKLDSLEAEIDAADRGNLIHEALEKFVKDYPALLPPNALEQLLAIGHGLLEAYQDRPDIQAFWWPRFERIAAWFVATESARRVLGVRPLGVETSGQVTLGGFTLKGRADRVDRLADGTFAIIDYKTGGVPTRKEVQAGIEPQLPLLAFIAVRSGFKDIAPAAASHLSYWKLGGGPGENANKETDFTENLAALMEEAEMGLRTLIAAFADPATPYQAVPKPGLAPRFDDYAHLARLAEWGRTGES